MTKKTNSAVGQLYRQSTQKDEQFTVGENGELVQKSKQELKKQFKADNEIASLVKMILSSYSNQSEAP